MAIAENSVRSPFTSLGQEVVFNPNDPEHVAHFNQVALLRDTTQSLFITNEGLLCVYIASGDQTEPFPLYQIGITGNFQQDIENLHAIVSSAPVFTPEEFQVLEGSLIDLMQLDQHRNTSTPTPEQHSNHDALERLIARGAIDFSHRLDGTGQDPERVYEHLQAIAEDRTNGRRYNSSVQVVSDPDCGMVAELRVSQDKYQLQGGYRERVLNLQNKDEQTLRDAVNYLGELGVLTEEEKRNIYWHFYQTVEHKNTAVTRQHELSDPYVLSCLPQLANVRPEDRLDWIHSLIDRIAMERTNDTLQIDQGWHQDGTAFSTSILLSGNDHIQITTPHTTSELMANSQAGRDHMLYLLQDIGLLLEAERLDIETAYGNEMPIGNQIRLKIEQVATQIMPEELVQKTGGTRLKDFSYFPCLQPGTQHYLRTAKLLPSQAVYHYVALNQPDDSSATQLTMVNAFRDAIHGQDNNKKILDSIYRTMLHSPTNPVLPTLMRSKDGRLYAVIVHQPRRMASEKTRELMSSEAKIIMESALERYYRKLANWRID